MTNVSASCSRTIRASTSTLANLLGRARDRRRRTRRRPPAPGRRRCPAGITPRPCWTAAATSVASRPVSNERRPDAAALAPVAVTACALALEDRLAAVDVAAAAAPPAGADGAKICACASTNVATDDRAADEDRPPAAAHQNPNLHGREVPEARRQPEHDEHRREREARRRQRPAGQRVVADDQHLRDEDAVEERPDERVDRNTRVGRLEAEDRDAVEEDGQRAEERDSSRPAVHARDRRPALGQEAQTSVDARCGRAPARLRGRPRRSRTTPSRRSSRRRPS